MEHQSVQGGMQAKNACTGGFMAMDCGAGSPISEDMLNLSGQLNFPNFDGFNESSSPLSSDLLFSSFNYSSLYPMFGNSASLTSPCGLEQARDSSLEDEGTSGYGNSRLRERLEAQKPILQSEFSQRSAREGELDSVETDVKKTSNVILKSIGNFTFSDRMLKVLSLLKESSGWGILAQVWIPIKQGDNYILSTCEQPFLLDHVLTGYREVSRLFTFSAKETPGMFPGVPGRVFISGRPEWTSNVLYYNKFEYLRVEYAISHEVRGSLAVPVFDPHRSKCCAVLELVTMKEKSNFDVEMENVCRALQAVDLRMTKARVHHQNLTKEQLSALSEILDVLRAVCHAHMLPLALTWTPMACDSGTIDDDVAGSAGISKTKQCLKEIMICIQESACYVNDAQMHGFLQACAELCLAEGQGIAGKALLSSHPFFSPDVKGYDIGDYPLAHHARKFGLQAAVAIKLRSTYTGDDDFILEFFLPVNCKGSAEQQLLLNNLSATMQRICKSLRTVLDAEVAKPVVSEVDMINFKVTNSLPSEINGRCSQLTEKNLQMSERNVEVAGVPPKDPDMVSDEQVKFGLQKQTEKKRSTSEKHISLNVLQQYFAGSLKDAAKGLGVCPTTLKRICRQHGISRWPSRKIKKVNHSLKKIQSVINSVQGVEGALQYDPKTGCLIAAVSPEKSTTVTPGSISKSCDVPFSSTPRFGDGQLSEKLEGQRVNVASKLNLLNSYHSVTNEVDVLPNEYSTKSKVTSSSLEISRHTDIKGSGSGTLPLRSEDVNLVAKDGCIQDSTDKIGLPNFVPMSSDSVAEEEEMDVKIDLNVGRERSHSSFSSMTDSSNESTSCYPTIKKSLKNESFVSCKGPVYTVKATYKSDTVRFKLLPSMGCLHLYEEVRKRFKLFIGKFQLNYMDDEEDWVMLTTDSDLQECIEVMESLASQSIKLQVRDVPCSVSAQPAVAAC